MTTKAEPEKTFKTFRDLKTISPKSNASSASTTSISSITSSPSKPSNTSISRTPSRSSTSSISRNRETSPVRDFQKIPNSITREALPQGNFRGKSKHVYDYLWSVSRGAIQPTRFVKKSRREIKQGSGLGSMVTVDASIEHLVRIGLIKVTPAVGSLVGNQYEIFAPDEIDLTSTSISSTASTTSLTQKVDILDNPESGTTRRTQTNENTIGYGDAKTIFKTLNQSDDDSPLAAALNLLNEAAKRATGKGLTGKDFEALKEVVELIIAETELARARTPSISVYLKFAAENLRRRLYSKPQKPTGKSEQKPNWVSVGKTKTDYDETAEEIAPEPLSEESRQNALVILRGMLRNSTIESLQSLSIHYTSEDWKWLMNELESI